MSFWVAYVGICMILYVMLEMILLVLWYKKINFFRENLQRLILTGDEVWEENIIVIRSGNKSSLIHKTWHVTDNCHCASFGVLQTIMARNLHKRAR